MRSYVLKGLFFIIAAVMIISASLHAKTYEELLAEEEYSQNEIIITYSKDKNFLERKDIEYKNGLKKGKKIQGLNSYVYEIPAGEDSKKFKEKLKEKKIKGVEAIDINYIRKIHYTPYAYPNDDYYLANHPYNMWNISIAEVDHAWNEPVGSMSDWSQGNTGTVIAILDTGMRATHEDLFSKVMPGQNFSGVGNAYDVTDNHFHGTAVGSVAAALVNNNAGLTGFAANPLLMPVKISTDGNISSVNSASAIIWAADNGAKVLNLSYGGYSSTTIERNACAYAVAAGCVIVASTGNDNSSYPTYPSSFPDVIAVGSSSRYDSKSDFSNYGANIDCVGPAGWGNPGDRVICASKDGDDIYGLKTGTSFSAPEVSGMSAILVSNGVENIEVEKRIARTCDKVGTYPYTTVTGKTLGTWNQYMGYGRINFYRAMKTLVPPGNMLVTGLTGNVTTTWSAPSLSDTATVGYNIYRRVGASGSFVKINTSLITSTTYVDINVNSGQDYYYYTTAIDSNGFETRASNVDGGIVGGTVATKTFTPTPSPTQSATATVTPTKTVTATITGSPPTATVTRTWTPTAMPTNGCIRLDPSFNGSGVVIKDKGEGTVPMTILNKMIIDSNGKIVGVGARSGTSDLGAAVWRYNEDGSNDQAFLGGGTTFFYPGLDCRGEDIDETATGDYIVAGNIQNYVSVIRFSSDGIPDWTFNGGTGYFAVSNISGGNLDKAFAVDIDSSERIVFAGLSWRTGAPSMEASMLVGRLNSDGTEDTTFSGDGYFTMYNTLGKGTAYDDYAFGVTVDDATGKIYVVGQSGMSSPAGGEDMVVWRLNSNGTLDTTFNGTGYISHSNAGGGDDNDVGIDLIIDNAGKLVIAGYSYGADGNFYAVLWRYLSNGTIDTTFNGTGYTIQRAIYSNSTAGAYEVKQDAAGDYVMVGHVDWGTNDDMCIWKIKNDGTLDTTFNGTGYFYTNSVAGGTYERAYSVSIDSQGRYVVGGRSQSSGNYALFWRCLDTCAPSPYTPTMTLTPGLAQMFTITSTITATVTISPTGTPPTLTVTQTTTPGSGMTETVTPTVTSTVTQTHTQADGTFTVTPTVTQSVTAENTSTVTATDTPLATMTMTLTASPTITITVTATSTMTSTVTSSPTLTVTQSPTPSITKTHFTSTPTITLTPTRTATPEPSSTITATYTSTTGPPTLTYTPTMVPTQETFTIEDPFIYPNPITPGMCSFITFNFFATQNFTYVTFDMYTTGFRLIRRVEIQGNYPAGKNDFHLGDHHFRNLANGIYYYVITVQSDSGKKTKSRIEELIILN